MQLKLSFDSDLNIIKKIFIFNHLQMFYHYHKKIKKLLEYMTTDYKFLISSYKFLASAKKPYSSSVSAHFVIVAFPLS